MTRDKTPDDDELARKFFGEGYARETQRVSDLVHHGPYTGPAVTFLRQKWFWLLIGAAVVAILVTYS